MGQLARVGIAFGRRAPLASLTGLPAIARLDSFGRRLLGIFGFAGLAQKIASETPLTVSEIELLLRNAPTPVLLKLVEIVHPVDAGIKAPRPAVILPLAEWSKNKRTRKDIVQRSRRFLCDLPYEQLEVAIDGVDIEALQDQSIQDALLEISRCRDGVQLVGPSPDQILAMCSEGGAVNEAQFSVLLRKLRDSGFSRLRMTPSAHLAAVAEPLGFPRGITTDLAHLSRTTDIAGELVRLGEQTDRGARLDVWAPAIGDIGVRAQPSPESDMKILRTLALGTITLPHARIRRASSRVLSVEALAIAHHFGANDLGFGAVDDNTARALGLSRIDQLSSSR